MGCDGDCDFQTLDQYINVLQSGSKRDKKSALESLKTVVATAEGKVLVEIHGRIQNQLILNFQDSIEAVREGALILSQDLIERLPVDKTYISLLLPSLYPRVCREKDFESSEELRLVIGKFLVVIVEKYQKLVAPYMTEMVDMICRLLRDPSPDIKQTTSRLLGTLVQNLPLECFQFTIKFCPALIENLNHQRWKVRVSTVEAIEWLMLKGDNKCVVEVTPALNKKMLDSMYQVRMALVKLAGHWLTKLPDRYSFFPHLIPLVLSGLADDHQDVVDEARRLWEEAGEVYLRENETDLKDRINYENEMLDHYPVGVVRPSLGCRVLIEREATKFLLALVNELTDWMEMVRIKSALLLTQVVLHFEHSITMSIRKIITHLCRAARDRETPLVVANVKLAAEYMGYFVPANTYCDLIVEYMKEAHEGEVLVVAAIVRGSKRSDLVENLPKIATLLEQTTFKGCRQLAILDFIESLMNVCQSDIFVIGDYVFKSLISIAGLSEGEVIRDKVVQLLNDFAQLGGGNKREVYGKHASSVLSSLTDTVWTEHCHEQFVLHAIINAAGDIIGDHVDAVIEIFRSALKPGNDPVVLLKIVMAVNDLLSNCATTLPSEDVMSKFVRAMLSELLPPHLKWSAGRSSEAIRTIACTCLYMCLCKLPEHDVELNNTLHDGPPKSKLKIEDTTQLPSSSDDYELPVVDFTSLPNSICGLQSYFEPLLPLLMSLLQDPAPKTRLLSLNCVKIFTKLKLSHEPQHVSLIVGQVLKRLDDADRTVRNTSVQVLKTYYAEQLKCGKCEQISQTLVEFVYSTMLIHLDDKDPNLKQSVLEALDVISDFEPATLRAKVFPDNFRDKEVCQKLVDILDIKIKNLKI